MSTAEKTQRPKGKKQYNGISQFFAKGEKKKEVMFIKYQAFEESKVKNVCVTDHQEILSVFCSFWEYGVIINEFF